jgi:hypothetical protein
MVDVEKNKIAASHDTLILTRPMCAVFTGGFPIRLDTLHFQKVRIGDLKWKEAKSEALTRNVSDTSFEIKFLGDTFEEWLKFSRVPGDKISVPGLIAD